MRNRQPRICNKVWNRAYDRDASSARAVSPGQDAHRRRVRLGAPLTGRGLPTWKTTPTTSRSCRAALALPICRAGQLDQTIGGAMEAAAELGVQWAENPQARADRTVHRDTRSSCVALRERARRGGRWRRGLMLPASLCVGSLCWAWWSAPPFGPCGSCPIRKSPNLRAS